MTTTPSFDVDPEVTVYTLPDCVQCVSTFRALDRAGVPHLKVQLTDDTAEQFKADGHMQAPIVVTPSATWAGFRPDLIAKIKENAA